MFSNMKPVERRLLEHCKVAKVLELGNERPTEKTVDNEIRGEFLRVLILSNNQEIDENGTKYILKIDPKGLNVQGAYISGTFDFSFCNTDLPFVFLNSVFEKKINLSDSKIRSLSLSGSKVFGINAQGLICQGDIFLINDFESTGKVDFISAQIGASLYCENGKFYNENDRALICNGAKIEGAVFLRNGFESKGEVNFGSAQMFELSCTKGKFNNKNGIALNCNCAKIKGSVFLNDGFEATGEVNFASTQIGSNLEAINGKFDNENGTVLTCNRSKIEGSVFLNDSFGEKGKLNFALTQIGKSLIFSNVQNISVLILNFAQINRLNGDFKNVFIIYLDGLKYEHLDIKDLSFNTFKNWLDKMPEFKPQPYKQLAKVLRNMGHNEDANDIMIKYNEELRKKDFLTCNRLFISILKWIYAKTAGYGYKPMSVIKWMSIVWLLCSLFYWNASKVAVFAPTNPLVFQKKDYYECHVEENGTALSDIFNWKKYNNTNNWIDSKLEGEYTTFNPFMYSLDVILPIVDLQVEKDWGQYVSSNNGTLNDFTRWIMWFEILFGWIYSLILVAILSGLAKNEKD